MVSMLVLFGNFYLQTYIKKKKIAHKKHDNNGAASNGMVSNGHSNGQIKEKSQ